MATHLPGYEFDESRWPLITVRRFGLTTTEQDNGLFRQLSAVLLRKKPYATLVDFSRIVPGGREKWDLFSGYLADNKREIERYSVSTALVFADPSQRAAVNAVMMRHPIPGPYAIFKDERVAIDWLRGRLRETGVVLPPQNLQNSAFDPC